MIQPGKVPNDILKEQIFNQLNFKRDEIVVYPSVGEDCSVLEFESDMQIVLSTDPITGAISEIGHLAVNISCNDVSSAGAEPVGILVTLLLPVGATKEDIHCIMKDIHHTAKKNNVVILGGHSEVTDAVIRPIISTTVIGKVKKGELVCTNGAGVGDDVILTKWAGIEGTSIIAHDYEQVLAKHLSQEIIEEAKALKEHLSVIEESKVIHQVHVTSMHDVTEGGVLGGCYEVAECGEVGITVELDKIPVLKCTKEICKCCGISPYRLISSGSMIMTTPEGEKCVELLKEKGIEATIIGHITPIEKKVRQANLEYELVAPESDELYKVILHLKE
ncbi:MAG: AIR synthase family protein [Cellulosilyticaceae bacterium]